MAPLKCLSESSLSLLPSSYPGLNSHYSYSFNTMSKIIYNKTCSSLHIFLYFLFLIFISTVVDHRILNIDSSLCYTIGHCYLSILNEIVYIYNPQTPSPSASLPGSPGKHKSVLYMSRSLLSFYRFLLK